MQYIDVYAGGLSKDKLDVARRLDVSIAPGDLSVLVSKNKSEIRKKRPVTDFVAAEPKSKQEMNSFLTDTHYDFVIVSDFRLGKRNVRMAKRYETAIAVPLSPAMSLSSGAIAKVRTNLLMVQEIGGTLLLCSGARDASQIRSGPDLAAIGVLLGLKPDLSMKAVKHNTNFILNRNRSMGPAPGVRHEVHED